jgi:nucleotide-binding universal stress UspA family protein
MVGCKEKSALKRFLLGSVTHRMARYANCTVWAVRGKQDQA